MRRVVVVGGVAGGMSAAARLRRLDESAQIVVLERGGEVSFANCGLPYHVGGEIPHRDALLLHTPESLQESLDLDVRVRHDVRSIDRAGKTVTVRDLVQDVDVVLPYDALVLATGADPIVPPLPGLDRPQVRTLRTVPDADVLRAMVDEGATKAVVIGAGFIGLETVEAFRHRGLDVTLVEMAPQVLPAIDAEMAVLVEAELRAHQVDVRTGVGFVAVEESATEHPVDVVLADGERLPADVVLLGVGVRPSTALAREAGLELSDRGAVVVTSDQRTSDPSIWAVGDAIQVIDAVTGVPGVVPLAGPANRQGRTAADSIVGRARVSKPVLGTAVVKVFGLTAAVTGPTSRRLTAAGVEHLVVHLHPGKPRGLLPGRQGGAPDAAVHPRGPGAGRAGRGQGRRRQADRRHRDGPAGGDDGRRPRRARARLRAAVRQRQGPGQHGRVHGPEHPRRDPARLVGGRPRRLRRSTSCCSTSVPPSSSSRATCPVRSTCRTSSSASASTRCAPWPRAVPCGRCARAGSARTSPTASWPRTASTPRASTAVS